jgi:hypothetical protein
MHAPNLQKSRGTPLRLPRQLRHKPRLCPPCRKCRKCRNAPRVKSETAPPARADGLDPDAGAYLDRLRLYGTATYGAMASAMGWGATRAWRAEAKLRAAGLVLYREGRAVPLAGKCDIVTP